MQKIATTILFAMAAISAMGQLSAVAHFESSYSAKPWGRPLESEDQARHLRGADLSHIAVEVDYAFARGWSAAAELQVEHGLGAVPAIDPIGSRQTNVSIEQMWIRKDFGTAFGLTLGKVGVTIGGLNFADLPDDYLGVYAPIGESAVVPGGWHRYGLMASGELTHWSYEAAVYVPLTSAQYSGMWLAENELNARLGAAARIDNYSIDGLHLGASGFWGQYHPDGAAPLTVGLAAVDADYTRGRLRGRAGAVYGHRRAGGRGANAIGGDIELGVDIMPAKVADNGGELFVFGRYDAFSLPADGARTVRHRLSAGADWFPIPHLVIKAEWAWCRASTIGIAIGYVGHFGR